MMPRRSFERLRWVSCAAVTQNVLVLKVERNFPGRGTRLTDCRGRFGGEEGSGWGWGGEKKTKTNQNKGGPLFGQKQEQLQGEVCDEPFERSRISASLAKKSDLSQQRTLSDFFKEEQFQNSLSTSPADNDRFKSSSQSRDEPTERRAIKREQVAGAG